MYVATSPSSERFLAILSQLDEDTKDLFTSQLHRMITVRIWNTWELFNRLPTDRPFSMHELYVKVNRSMQTTTRRLRDLQACRLIQRVPPKKLKLGATEAKPYRGGYYQVICTNLNEVVYNLINYA